MVDIMIKETFNGGDITILNNDVMVVTGIENMPYLSMFGGGDWWGNDLLLTDGPDLKFIATTEALCRVTTLNSNGRALIEAAVLADLAFLETDVPGTTLNVTVQVLDDNVISITVFINLQQVFYMLWNPVNPVLSVLPVSSDVLLNDDGDALFNDDGSVLLSD